VKTRLGWAAWGTLIAALAAGVPASGRASDLAIKIAFDQTFDRIEPSPVLSTTRQEVAATLSPSGEVTYSEKHFHNGAEIVATNMAMRLGKSESMEWRVVDRNTLANSKEYKSFVRTILVTISDANCVAQVHYQLKSSDSDYRYTSHPSGLPAVARSVRADNVTCAIEQRSQR
jgi:hypothetical protein